MTTFFVCVLVVRNGNQGLTSAKQVFCHWMTTPDLPKFSFEAAKLSKVALNFQSSGLGPKWLDQRCSLATTPKIIEFPCGFYCAEYCTRGLVNRTLGVGPLWLEGSHSVRSNHSTYSPDSRHSLPPVLQTPGLTSVMDTALLYKLMQSPNKHKTQQWTLGATPLLRGSSISQIPRG